MVLSVHFSKRFEPSKHLLKRIAFAAGLPNQTWTVDFVSAPGGSRSAQNTVSVVH
jgi:hypothetical protein